MLIRSCTATQMVNKILAERILSDIKLNLNDLQNASDITWDVYRVDKRARRFVERTLHILIEACMDIAQHIIFQTICVCP